MYLIWPFSLNAVAVGVARLYRNRPVDFRACYQVVLQRWSQILALMLVELLVLVGWYVAAILVIVAVFFVVAALSAASAAFAFWFGFIGFVIVFVAMVPLLAPLFVALTFAMYATVIEESPVIASLLQGFARVFNRGEFWRALLFAIATGAVVAGASTAFSVLGMLAAFAHLPSVKQSSSRSRARCRPLRRRAAGDLTLTCASGARASISRQSRTPGRRPAFVIAAVAAAAALATPSRERWSGIGCTPTGRTQPLTCIHRETARRRRRTCKRSRNASSLLRGDIL